MMGNTMTVARRWRKLPSWGLRTGFAVRLWKLRFRALRTVFATTAALAALGAAAPIGAATTERIVIDRNSGLAIGGFDPVAYFTDAQALPGKDEFEQVVAGAIWRFRSDGNRAAFVADPNVYAPRFGGYDPVGVARGVAVAGNPLLWVISGDRLYLFYRPETKDEFAGDRDHTISTADRAWPSILRTLVP
jgi:hypothetical protein